MRKKINIFIFLTLILNSIYLVSAFNAKLSFDDSEININDNLNFRISIDSENWWEINIKEIKWIEKFDVIWTSQSQNSYSKFVVINWKTESKTEIIFNVDYTLKAKETWDFQIWPAIINYWTWEYQTNVVNVKVSWTKMFLNNSRPKTQNNIKKTRNLIDENNYQFDEEKGINYYFILLSFWFLIIIWTLYLIIKKYYDKILAFVNENILKIKPEKKEEPKINFEVQKKEIIYPDINDYSFSEKIDFIFKEKLTNKYWIKNISKKTYDEILAVVDDKIDEKNKEILLKIIQLLNKTKYSNLITDNNKLLELVRILFE